MDVGESLSRGIRLKAFIAVIAALMLLSTMLVPTGNACSPGTGAQSWGYYPAGDGGSCLGCPGCPGCPDNPERQPDKPGCYALGCPGCPGCPDGNNTTADPGGPGCL